jgi:limonene-1,2-epoxide hydrolase
LPFEHLPSRRFRAMADARAVVEEFFNSLDTKSLDDHVEAMRSRVGESLLWTNSGLPTCNGMDEAEAFVRGFAAGVPFVGMQVEVIAVAVAGDTVVTERIDRFLDADGNVLASLPLAGTLVVADGKIVQWRDYFDPRQILGG